MISIRSYLTQNQPLASDGSDANASDGSTFN